MIEEPKQLRRRTLSSVSHDGEDMENFVRSTSDQEFELDVIEEYDILETTLDPVAAKLKFLNALNFCGMDDNIFVLVCLFFATTSFTFAQLLGAVAANSLAMYGDCATMGLDSLTYLLNIYCEKRRIAGSAQALRLEVFVAAISVGALTFVTVFLLWDSLQRLKSGHIEGEDVDVDIMLEFSLANFVIDIFSCSVFLSKIKETKVTKPKHVKKTYEPLMSTDSSMSPLYSKEEEDNSKSRLKIEVSEDVDIEIINKRRKSITKVETIVEPRNLNMASAFLHLGADTLRTLTVMITAIVVDADSKDIDSVDADAIGSIVVCVIILAVVVALCFELVGLTMSLGKWENVSSGSDDCELEADELRRSNSTGSMNPNGIQMNHFS